MTLYYSPPQGIGIENAASSAILAAKKISSENGDVHVRVEFSYGGDFLVASSSSYYEDIVALYNLQKIISNIID